MLSMKVIKMGKKRLGALIAAVALSCSMASADPQINTTLDGRSLYFDQPPVMRDGRVLVPLRGLFESLGADVLYDSATRNIKATAGAKTVELTLGERQAFIDGRQVYLDVAANTIGGRTMVPLRFVSEALGAEVDWHPSTKTVAIASSAGDVAEEPPQADPVSTVTIDSMTVSPQRTLRPGDRLTVTMLGSANANATFSIPGTIEDVMMRELSPGWYQGQIVIGQNHYADQSAIIGYLVKDGRRVAAEGSRTVSIDQSRTDDRTGAMQLTPAPESNVSNTRPFLQADFEVPVRPGTVSMTVDGQALSENLSSDQKVVTALPSYDLSPGRHQMRVQALALDNSVIDRSWSFVVVDQSHVNSNQVTVANLSNGASVPPVFNIQGRTEPYSRVQIEAQPQRALVPGIIGIRGQTMTARTIADASGWYDVQLDTSRLPQNTEIDLSVRSLNSAGQTTSSVELDVIRR